MHDTTGTILTPDGELAQKPTQLLSQTDAELLRQYKKFLERHGLREALYCNACWDRSLSDGIRAFVTDAQILIDCRCKMRFYMGQTF